MFENLPDLFHTLLNSEKIIQYGGLTLIVIVIFAETGLFIGFFLPGDYLLFTSGVLCGTNYLDIPVFILLISLTLASVAGNYVGFYTGKTLGKRLFTKPDSRFFKKERVEKAKRFYDKKGALSLVLGRFLPIIRTFSPIIAGAIDMDIKKFSYYNWLGGFLWIWSLVLTGFFLGRTYPEIIHYLNYFIFGFILITTIILIKNAMEK
ncbi:MAG: VTT domain-containing protein [Bacteroidota bacterium]